jgi:RNA ligase (TIGR02306 family)
MRKLASIQKVISVSPIPGADRIEKIQVLGWQLVSRKGEFQAGDYCVYFEIDSVLPDTSMFSFLWPDGSRPDNFRLRSKRMRGVLSQGLALPVSLLPESRQISEGTDVTSELGITKWEPASTSGAREIAGNFPTHLFNKTDEIRLQSVPEVLDELRGAECYAAVKLDGQSLTYAKHRDAEGETQYVCTRNYALKDIEGSPHWGMARELGIFDKMPAGFAVQGEFIGESIQGNRLGIRGKAFYAFQVFDISKQAYLDFADFQDFCSRYSIPTVPILWIKPLDMSLETALAAAEGSYDSGHPREGIVIRPTRERNSPVIASYLGGGIARTSFKVINNTFLLKIGE